MRAETIGGMLLLSIVGLALAQNPIPCDPAHPFSEPRCTPTPTRPKTPTTVAPTPTGVPPTPTATQPASGWNLVVPIPSDMFSVGPNGTLLLRSTGKPWIATLKKPDGTCYNVSLVIPQSIPVVPTSSVVARR